MAIIAIGGRRRRGKDFVSTLIANLSLKNYYRIAYADAMKRMFAERYNVNLADLYDEAKKEQYRPDMIKFAEGLREKNPYIFVDLLRKDIKGRENVIITDTRRPPEVEWSVTDSHHLVKVWCDDETAKRRGAVYTKGVDDSDTETYLDEFRDAFFYQHQGAAIDNSDERDVQGQVKLFMRAYSL